ncbi:MAG: hypothetical protein CMN97_11400 [Synechococcus sp. NAT40]|nr:hypothetical protein [Synechococcus sp. NAT40]RZO11973.1 MAG: hypothetical protein EVB08_08735 [Synechococcus sp. MED-G135]
MPNALIPGNGQRCVQSMEPSTMDVHQGDCIQLIDSCDLFQVIGIDDCHDRCWVRRWPLQASGGSHVFEVSLGQICLSDASDRHEDAQGAASHP